MGARSHECFDRSHECFITANHGKSPSVLADQRTRLSGFIAILLGVTAQANSVTDPTYVSSVDILAPSWSIADVRGYQRLTTHSCFGCQVFGQRPDAFAQF